MLETEKIIGFIEDYKSHALLWQVSHRDYPNKVLRTDALRALGQKYNMEIHAVKNKIKSLRSYFCREHQRILKKNSSNGGDVNYVSAWFAYDSMSFLSEYVTQKETKETEPCNGNETFDEGYPQNDQAPPSSEVAISYSASSWDPLTGQFNSPTTVPETTASFPGSCWDPYSNRFANSRTGPETTASFSGPSWEPLPSRLVSPRTGTEVKAPSTPPIKMSAPSIRTKRKITREQISPKNEKEQELCTFYKTANGEILRKDENSIFGDLVATKIRKFSVRNQAVAQNYITNYLFELEMQEFDSPQETTPLHQSTSKHSDDKYVPPPTCLVGINENVPWTFSPSSTSKTNSSDTPS